MTSLNGSIITDKRPPCDEKIGSTVGGHLAVEIDRLRGSIGCLQMLDDALPTGTTYRLAPRRRGNQISRARAEARFARRRKLSGATPL